MSNPIVVENQNTGTTAWQIPKNYINQIQAYVDKTSYNTGDTVTFYVSTIVAGTLYSINIYRLGYYGGTGGCLKYTVSNLVGQQQGYYDSQLQTLNNCPTAIIDNVTHNLETGWASSYTLAIPSNWVTGCYLVVFTDANNVQSYTHFIVKGNTTADYAIVRAYLTECAYNNWGNYSLYANPTIAQKTSFNRPFVICEGSQNLLQYDFANIRWLEYMGYNLSYLSDVDIHATAGILTTYKAIIFLGHAEYWSFEQRNSVELALASGIGLAFMGANDCYWQIRLGNDAAGNPNRTVTCYKVQSILNNYANDPFYGVDNTRVTTLWRDALLARPESALIGVSYKAATLPANYPWTVDSNANSPYLTGTGLVSGQSYGTDVAGGEWDRVQTGSSANIQIIGTTTSPSSDISNTTTYIAASGALVFASGNFNWSWGLDSYRFVGTASSVPGMQQFMAHIMTALIRPKNPTGFSATSAFHA